MAAPQPPKPRTPRARRWLRRAIATLVLLLAAALVLPQLMPERLVGGLVAARIRAATGLDARVEGASFSLLSGLRARGITIAQPPGFGDGNLAAVARLTASIPLGSLLRGRPRSGDARLDGLQLDLIRNAQGEWNLPQTRPGVRTGILVIRDSRVRFRDLAGGADQVIEVSAAEFPPAGNGGRFAIRGELPRKGGFSLTGDLVVNEADGSFRKALVRAETWSISLATLAGVLLERPLEGGWLGLARIDASLEAEATAERTLSVRGPIEIHGLPLLTPDPARSREGGLRIAVELELSRARQHLGVKGSGSGMVSTELALTLDEFITVPKLSASLALRGDLPTIGAPQGGGKPMAASCQLTLAGDPDELRIAGGLQLQPETPVGAKLSGDSLDLGLTGVLRLTALSGEVSWTAKAGGGFAFGGSIRARPEVTTDPKISPSGELPPMIVRGKAEASVDFARLPPGFHDLIDLVVSLPSAGTLKAAASVALRDPDAGSRDEVLALAGLAPGARPDDWRVGARFQARAIPMDGDFWLLREIPFLGVVAAVLGGKPHELSFVATSQGEFGSHGRGVEELVANLAGKGDSRLDDFRVVGSPLLGLLAILAGKPALKELTFERVDAPFSVHDEMVVSRAALHYEKGSFIVAGTTGFDGKLDYRLTVQNPKGIGIIPTDLVDYFDAGKAALVIQGTADAPKPRILTEAITMFQLEQRLRKPPGP